MVSLRNRIVRTARSWAPLAALGPQPTGTRYEILTLHRHRLPLALPDGAPDPARIVRTSCKNVFCDFPPRVFGWR